MSVEHDDTECEHLLEAATLSAQLVEALHALDTKAKDCGVATAEKWKAMTERDKAQIALAEMRTVLTNLVEICEWLRPQLPRGTPPWRQLDEAAAFLARTKGTP